MKIYIDRQAQDLGTALVRSASDRTPVQFPQLLAGSNRSFKVQLVSGGDVDPASGDGEYGLTVSIGRRGAFVLAGFWALKSGAMETVSLPWNVSPRGLQTALEAITGPETVKVSGESGKVYRIEFAGILEAGAKNLLEPTSTVSVVDLGDGVWVVRLRRAALVTQTNWQAGDGGWTGLIRADSCELLRAVSGGNFVGLLEILLTDPEGGVITIAHLPVTVFSEIG